MYCGGFLLKEHTDVRDYQISYVHHKKKNNNNNNKQFQTILLI